MTTKQLIAKLQPLRTDVSRARNRLHDCLASGAQPPTLNGYLDTWRNAVRSYLDMLAGTTINEQHVTAFANDHAARLQKGFDLPYPESGVDAWKHDKHFQKLLNELEVAYDLLAGHTATRRWLLAQDALLRQTIQRSEKNQWQHHLNEYTSKQPQEAR